MTVSTKFKVDTTIRCLVIALLLLIRTLHDCDLDLWPFDLGQWSHMAGHVVNPSTKFEDPTAIRSWVMSADISHGVSLTMRLQLLRMRRITWPHIFEIPDPDLPIHYTTFMALRLIQMELSAKTGYDPVLKTTLLSAHAQNHVSIERCRKSFTTIVLGDHDFPLTTWNFGNLTAFRAILAILSLRMCRSGYLWTSG